MKPLRTRRSLAEDAADRVREEILTGGFKQGERLIEARIAQELGISRGPLREAFKLLRAEGLVKEEPNRGTFVVRLSGTDVRDIFELREALETMAVRLLVDRGRESELRELRKLLDQLETAAGNGDVRAVSRADLALHEAICRLSGNARLHAAFTRDFPTMLGLIRIDDQLYPSLETMAREHRPILDAVGQRDADLAVTHLQKHIREASDLVAAHIEALPENGPG
jgi:GntR family transcriptional regulator, gluconate operon transcriptional repressor